MGKTVKVSHLSEFERVITEVKTDVVRTEAGRSGEFARHQLLHYVAELAEELAVIASSVHCAKLMDHFVSASAEARRMLPKGYRD